MNPETFSAVALKYPENTEAPVIAAKAKGELARRMVSIAEENDIPVVQDEILSNVLSVQEVGECVSEETWLSVAKVFAFVAELEKDGVKRGIKKWKKD